MSYSIHSSSSAQAFRPHRQEDYKRGDEESLTMQPSEIDKTELYQQVIIALQDASSNRRSMNATRGPPKQVVIESDRLLSFRASQENYFRRFSSFHRSSERHLSSNLMSQIQQGIDKAYDNHDKVLRLSDDLRKVRTTSQSLNHNDNDKTSTSSSEEICHKTAQVSSTSKPNASSNARVGSSTSENNTFDQKKRHKLPYGHFCSVAYRATFVGT